MTKNQKLRLSMVGLGYGTARYLHVSTSHELDKRGRPVKTATAKRDPNMQMPRGGVASTARRLRQGKRP